MPTFELPEHEITIHAPAFGTFIWADADADLPTGQLFGLDTEGPYMTGAGVFGEGFHLRLVQIATAHVVWVFDMEDPYQAEYVREKLAHMNNSFCAHTNHDTVALAKTQGVDISLRCVDTRMLATMAQPDDRDGGNDLKTLARKRGMTWLPDAQKRMQQEFDRICSLRNAQIQASVQPLIEPVMRESYPSKAKWELAERARDREIKKLAVERGFMSTQVAKDAYAWSAIDKTSPQYLIYAGLDAVACRRLVPQLVKETSAPPSLLKVETWADAQAAQWKVRGYRIDREAHEKLWARAEEHCEKHREEFGKVVCERVLKSPIRNPHYIEVPVSPLSGKKVAQFLRMHGADFTGYPLTDTGKELASNGELTYEMEANGEYASLSKKHRVLLEAMPLDEIGREAVYHLMEFKAQVYTVTKMEEVAKVMDPDGYIHPTLRTIGAVTGRMSGSGPNMQNWGKKAVEMREIVVPEKGNVFFAADFDQIELRVVAALANVVAMIQVIKDGGDLHALTALLAQCSRDIAKIVAFLIVYGGGAKALNEQTGIPLNECKTIIANYRAGYPEIDAYSEYMASLTDEIRPISGRKIPVGVTEDGRSRSYANVNYEVQGSARELAVAAWWRYMHDPERKGEIVMLIHDELVGECPAEYAEEERARLERHMSFDFMGVPISAGGTIMADATGRPCWTSVDQAEKVYAPAREAAGIKVSPAA